jgi:tungstate transport system ATP-binding protein
VAQAVLEVHHLVVRYGKAEVVNVPSLQIWEQEVLAIMGPNGAGKSTLLRILAFLEAPTEGSVVFQGNPVRFRSREVLPLHRRIAVIFQEPLLLDATVFQNVALGLKLRGIKDRTQRVKNWLERFGIAHLYDRPAKSLSGGEAQRANLARAFVLSPEILLLDEPFSALDPPTRNNLLADLKGILAEAKTTSVFVTHDQSESRALGDRVAFMMNGRIRQLDTPEQIFSSPADKEVARFVGVENIWRGRVSSVKDGRASVQVHGKLVEVVGEAPPGEEVLVCVRPNDISLVNQQLSAARLENPLRAKVIRVIPLGPSHRVILDFGAPIVALIPNPSLQGTTLREGESVVVSFKAGVAHLIRSS